MAISIAPTFTHPSFSSKWTLTTITCKMFSTADSKKIICEAIFTVNPFCNLLCCRRPDSQKSSERPSFSVIRFECNTDSICVADYDPWILLPRFCSTIFLFIYLYPVRCTACICCISFYICVLWRKYCNNIIKTKREIRPT